jgi:hypothetical protein
MGCHIDFDGVRGVLRLQEVDVSRRKKSISVPMCEVAGNQKEGIRGHWKLEAGLCGVGELVDGV